MNFLVHVSNISALIIFYQGFKIILLSLPLLKEVNGQKVDINSMKITFQEELNMSTYKLIVDFIQYVNNNNLIFIKNFMIIYLL